MKEFSYIDTHAHLNLSAFADDREAVISRCAEASVSVINVGTKESTSQLAVTIAEAHENIYAIVGLHPIQTAPGVHDEDEVGEGSQPFTSRGEIFDAEFYRTLAKSKKVVGIGECGFDYFHHDPATRDIQEAAFIAQIELANELQLPLMIHTRNAKEAIAGIDAYTDVYEVLKANAKVPANIHFYAGTYEQAKRFFDIGCTISFTGVITFAKQYEELVKNAPLELIHAETDCPYVAPKPYRGTRAEPWHVIEVVKKIAELKSLPVEDVARQLILNAQKLYKINPFC